MAKGSSKRMYPITVAPGDCRGIRISQQWAFEKVEDRIEPIGEEIHLTSDETRIVLGWFRAIKENLPDSNFTFRSGSLVLTRWFDGDGHCAISLDRKGEEDEDQTVAVCLDQLDLLMTWISDSLQAVSDVS